MVVADDDLLVDRDGAVVNLADTNTPYIFIVVDRADQYLCACLGIALRCRDIVKDRLEQRCHVNACSVLVQRSDACLCRGVHEGAVKLGIVRVELEEKLQNFLDDLGRTRLRAVNLVDADNDGKPELQRLSEHKFCLRHGTLERVDDKDNTVHHLEDTLNLAAEIGMSRGIDDVNLGILIHNSCIF